MSNMKTWKVLVGVITLACLVVLNPYQDTRAQGGRFQVVLENSYGDSGVLFSKEDTHNAIAYNGGFHIFAAGQYKGTYPNRPNAQSTISDGLISMISLNGQEEDYDFVFPSDESSISAIKIKDQQLIYAGTFKGSANLNPVPGTPADNKTNNNNSAAGFIAGIHSAPIYGGSVVFKPENNGQAMNINDVAFGPDGVYVAGNFSGQYNFHPTNPCNFSTPDAWCGDAGSGSDAGFIAKYGPVADPRTGNSLDFQWLYTFGAVNGGQVTAIDVAGNGTVAVAGNIFLQGSNGSTTFSFPNYAQVFDTAAGIVDGVTILFDPNGAVLSANVFGSFDGEVRTTDIVIDQNSFEIIGDFNGTVDFQKQGAILPRTLTAATASDLFVVSYSAANNYEAAWGKNYDTMTDPINLPLDLYGKIAKDPLGGNIVVAHGKGGFVGKAPASGGSEDFDITVWAIDLFGNDGDFLQYGTTARQERAQDFFVLPNLIVVTGNAFDNVNPANNKPITLTGISSF